MKHKLYALTFIAIVMLATSPVGCLAATLPFHSANVAGISLGMNVSQVRSAYPSIKIYEQKSKFKGIQVSFLMGEVRHVGGNSKESLVLYFDSSKDREARVLKVVYWVGFDGKGKTIGETAIEIYNAKEAFLKKYGKPDLYRDVALNTYITYNSQRPGGIPGEVVLAAKITRSISTISMTGLLEIELMDKREILKQQAQWIQKDAELKARNKENIHF